MSGEFFCLVDQELGLDAARVQIDPRRDGEPWRIPFAELQEMLEAARTRLWELRRSDPE